MGLGNTPAVERRPLSQTRRRAKVDDLKLVIYHRRLFQFQKTAWVTAAKTTPVGATADNSSELIGFFLPAERLTPIEHP